MLIFDYFKEAALIQSCKLGVLDETVIPHWQLDNDLQSLEKRLQPFKMSLAISRGYIEKYYSAKIVTCI
jgi:hypothetical protein